MCIMRQYLAIVINGKSDDNITFEAENFKDASKYLKTRIKDGIMFQEIKLVELNTLISKKFFIK